MDRELRRKNLIIKGVKDEESGNREETKEDKRKVMGKIRVNVNMETEVDEMRRLGRYEGRKQRPILIKLITGNKKMQILQQSRELKGSNI
ncbi:unnamed protein product [Phaedon cochleariae]|uniref:Uncharacterized protein n=1 Tax=Phaedon cochleariae TaxID=80249 RepID=A0A9N9X3C5_PHACE|nr:unnamed protein product [Phaedon cochleariae]